MIPALLAAATDRHLHGAPLAYPVLLHLTEVLSLTEFRPVKAWAVADRLHIKPHTAGRALRVLTDRGYLERGEDDARGVGRYRLCWSPRAVQDAAERHGPSSLPLFGDAA